jgi:hypothetical protein
MRFRSLTTALTALVLVSGTAEAQVTYTFTTPEQDFNPNGFGTGFSYLSASFVEFDGVDPVGGGTGFFFFEAGAFLADGVYAATRDGLSGDGGSFYASAGDATLVVSGITSSVPEPSTLSLLSLGLGVLGVVARRRRTSR